MFHCNETGYEVESKQLILAMKHELKMIEISVKVQYNGLKETFSNEFYFTWIFVIKVRFLILY